MEDLVHVLKSCCLGQCGGRAYRSIEACSNSEQTDGSRRRLLVDALRQRKLRHAHRLQVCVQLGGAAQPALRVRQVVVLRLPALRLVSRSVTWSRFRFAAWERQRLACRLHQALQPRLVRPRRLQHAMAEGQLAPKPSPARSGRA